MRAVFFHKTSQQSECSCILGLPADDTGSLPVLKDDNGTTTISNRPIGTSNDDVNYHCEEGKFYDITIGISLKKTNHNNATALLPVVAMASYRYSTILEEIRYILVIDAKRTCLPNYPQDFSRYAYGNAAIAVLDKFLVTGHTTEVRSGLLYLGIITGNSFQLLYHGIITGGV